MLLPTAISFLQEGEAPAQEAPKGLFSGNFLIPMVLIVGIFYVVLILPERKKQKKREALLSSIEKGDKVMTSSGMYGNVIQIQEDVVTIQVADGVRIRFNRAAIQNVMRDEEPGSDKKS